MFWGLVLEPSKKYTQKVAQTFHISQAALDLKSSDQEPIQLVVEYENSNFVLATLGKRANIFQVPLDLIFKAGDQVSFRTIGNGKVHLSGYHVLDDLDSMLMKGEEESDYEEEMEVENSKKKRKKINVNAKKNKKAKLDEANEDESDDTDDDEEEEKLMKSAQKKKGKGNHSVGSSATDNDEDEIEFDEEEDEEGSDFEEEDDEDDDDDDLELEEEEDEDEELELEEEEDEDDEDDDIDLEELCKEEKAKPTPKSEKKKTANGIAFETKGKEKKNQKLNKSKTENKKQGSPNKETKTPKSEKKNEKQNKMSDGENTPVGKGSVDGRGGEKMPKTPKAEGAPDKKVLEGGVICEEIKIGGGPVAKPGKMVNVYYVGTLQSTKKQFDSVQSGSGFKFKLGKNEVIKGWDIGLNGMKVGGTRKLTIPPHLAYGAKGSPPVIPPNSTLVFTVELKGLS